MDTRKFRVVAGTHVHNDGREYVGGDVIESTEDLVKKLAGKFEEVPISTPVTRPGAPAPKAPPRSTKRQSAAAKFADADND